MSLSFDHIIQNTNFSFPNLIVICFTVISLDLSVALDIANVPFPKHFAFYGFYVSALSSLSTYAHFIFSSS